MDVNASGKDELSLDIQPARRDYVNMYRRQFWRALGLLVFVGAGLALWPVARAPQFRAELVVGSRPALLVLAGAYAGAWLFLAFTVEVLARSFAGYALRKSPEALRRQVLRLTPEGMHTGEQLVRWNKFSKAMETRSGFQLHLRDGRCMVLPRRQIASAGRIRQILKAHLGGNAKVRRA
jgi:hypothetical protein